MRELMSLKRGVARCTDLQTRYPPTGIHRTSRLRYWCSLLSGVSYIEEEVKLKDKGLYAIEFRPRPYL